MMPREYVGRRQRNEPIHIQESRKPFEALRRIRFLRGSSQRLDVLLILRFVAGVFFQFIGNIRIGAFVQVALRAAEILRQELLVYRLRKNIQSKIPPVELNMRVIVPGRGNARCAEKIASYRFTQKRRVLLRVIEEKFRMAMKTRARDKLIEFDRQARLFVDWLKTAAALESNTGIRQDLAPLPDHAFDIFMRIIFQRIQAR